MTSFVALLRAVNVGGKNLVPMAALRALAGQLGLADARTLLQSGNLLFRSERRDAAALERLMEAEAEKRLGVACGFFVRTAEEWSGAIARNPFAEEAGKDPARLVLLVLKNAPGRPAVEALRAAIRGRERIHADGRELYAVYPDGQGRSKLTVDLIERKLGTSATGRNWNTVLKLAG